jgi:hypothetical protein
MTFINNYSMKSLPRSNRSNTTMDGASKMNTCTTRSRRLLLDPTKERERRMGPMPAEQRGHGYNGGAHGQGFAKPT